MNDPKRELQDLIRHKVSGFGPDLADAVADAVIELFYQVEDHWDEINTSTYGNPWVYLDQRSLIAQVPREAVSRSRQPDRASEMGA